MKISLISKLGIGILFFGILCTQVIGVCTTTGYTVNCGIQCFKVTGLQANCCSGTGAGPCLQCVCWEAECLPYIEEMNCTSDGGTEHAFVRDYTSDWVCGGANCYYEP